MQPAILAPPLLPKVWTFEDIQALPDDVDWRRYEIVDGALVVSPGVAPWHEYASTMIRAVLDGALPPDTLVTGPLAVDLHPSYRIPDLLVVPMELIYVNSPLLRPADLLLVVEVMSPGSVTTDRITKPAQYAAGGITCFWRVETEPEPSLTAYQLDDGASVYRVVGTWGPGETARLEAPFPVTVVIDDLVPPARAADPAP